MAAGLASCSPEELSAALGGVDIFATTLSSKTGGPQSATDMRLATAFIVLSQVIVYAVLAGRTPGLAVIDPGGLHSWSELREQYFQRLRGTSYDALFALPVATLLDRKNTPGLLRRTVTVARNLSLLLPEHEVLGKIYHELVPDGLRKRVGAFYTNDAAAHLLARLAIHTADARVIDPACGSGALLLAAYLRLVALHEKREAVIRRHPRLLSQLTGIDVMPFALVLAGLNLLLQAPNHRGGSLRLGVADSTRLRPDSVVLDWKGKHRFVVGRHDVVLMNPPFTRGHTMTPQDKQQLHERFPTLRTHLGGLAGLQSYFLLLAHALLRKGGYLSTVLPASTFGTRSNRGLTSFLLSHFAIDLVILCRRRSAFSEQTNLRELLLLARKQKPSDTHRVTFAVVDKSPAYWNAGDVERFHAVLSEVPSADNALNLGPDIWVRRMPQAGFSQEPRLFYQSLLQTSSGLLSAYQEIRELADRIKLRAFPAVFRHLGVPYLLNPRGSFALGFKALNLLPNVEACLKANDVWFIAQRQPGAIRVRNRVTNHTVDLRLSDTIPCVRRLTGLTTVNSTDAIGLTLVQGGTPVAERLLTATFRRAEAAKYSRRLDACWHSRVAKTQTHLIMAYKADMGAPGTHLVATVFDDAAYPAGDAWVFPGLALDEARILALWMNSTFFLVDLLAHRTEQRGAWMRFDRPVLNRLLTLDPTLLSRLQRQRLLSLYARIQLAPLSSLLSQLTQSDRDIVDEEILRILGLQNEDAAALAKKCVSAAREAVSDLVTMMRGD